MEMMEDNSVEVVVISSQYGSKFDIFIQAEFKYYWAYYTEHFLKTRNWIGLYKFIKQLLFCDFRYKCPLRLLTDRWRNYWSRILLIPTIRQRLPNPLQYWNRLLKALVYNITFQFLIFLQIFSFLIWNLLPRCLNFK